LLGEGKPDGLLTLNAYQKQANDTATYPARDDALLGLIYLTAKLHAEAGECAQKVLKCWRDKNAIDPAVVAAELGDILWYAATVASALDYTLGDVAWANLEKLADRKRRNVIAGGGDNR
jgi:NTP pyrophosphatase (non-canonical NTP hydrolase)